MINIILHNLVFTKPFTPRNERRNLSLNSEKSFPCWTAMTLGISSRDEKILWMTIHWASVVPLPYCNNKEEKKKEKLNAHGRMPAGHRILNKKSWNVSHRKSIFRAKKKIVFPFFLSDTTTCLHACNQMETFLFILIFGTHFVSLFEFLYCRDGERREEEFW